MPPAWGFENIFSVPQLFTRSDPHRHSQVRNKWSLIVVIRSAMNALGYESTMGTNQNPETGAGQALQPDYENKKQLAPRLGVSVLTIDNLLTLGLPHLKLTSKLIRF